VTWFSLRKIRIRWKIWWTWLCSSGKCAIILIYSRGKSVEIHWYGRIFRSEFSRINLMWIRLRCAHRLITRFVWKSPRSSSMSVGFSQQTRTELSRSWSRMRIMRYPTSQSRLTTDSLTFLTPRTYIEGSMEMRKNHVSAYCASWRSQTIGVPQTWASWWHVTQSFVQLLFFIPTDKDTQSRLANYGQISKQTVRVTSLRLTITVQQWFKAQASSTCRSLILWSSTRVPSCIVKLRSSASLTTRLTLFSHSSPGILKIGNTIPESSALYNWQWIYRRCLSLQLLPKVSKSRAMVQVSFSDITSPASTTLTARNYC